MKTTAVETVFEGSNGRYYTGWQIRRNLENGHWKLCIRQRTPVRYLVETGADVLLLLTSIDLERLPNWLEVRVRGMATRVVDRRRSIPHRRRYRSR
ncbi:hypothetical protein EA462_04935 [Natrarchaeobius halalkaliphilus]|uniref:Uncharacterized protein n=1 Tax=Natrarchaeobius halalkaliphilus TaxID=1679091 RepID=A0A3N6LQ58_9EURY|nr:hypothetical protein [Natrarchaeobius halalkaliphilus]RQG91708.1 hypothetical protein EA462_04935 [Natrarchaeobius halalkaliphilus]